MDRVYFRPQYGVERTWQWLRLGACTRAQRVHRSSGRHWPSPDDPAGNLLGLAEVVRGWQADRLLRNSSGEHVDARVFGLSARATSQIVSIDLATGTRTEETSAPGLKLMPQFLPGGRIGFLTKSGERKALVIRTVREPSRAACVHPRGRPMASRWFMKGGLHATSTESDAL